MMVIIRSIGSRSNEDETVHPHLYDTSHASLGDTTSTQNLHGIVSNQVVHTFGRGRPRQQAWLDRLGFAALTLMP